MAMFGIVVLLGCNTVQLFSHQDSETSNQFHLKVNICSDSLTTKTRWIQSQHVGKKSTYTMQ